MAGRPTKYKPEYIDMAHKLAREGLIDTKIADIIGISEKTLYTWKNEYPLFSQALKNGKDEFDNQEVEKSLRWRATGYSHPDVHVSNYKGEITVTEITKHYPPDTTAMIFWLKNRQPRRWRDRHDVEIGVKIEDILAALPKEYAGAVRVTLAKTFPGKSNRISNKNG